jgi:hypothetical protein
LRKVLARMTSLCHRRFRMAVSMAYEQAMHCV